MLFRSSDLFADFERLTRGLNLNPDLTKFDPENVDFENFDLERVVDGLTSTLSNSFSNSASFHGPGVDAVRTTSSLKLYIDLPGIDPATVDLTVDGRSITIAANREFAIADDAKLTHAGRKHGAFTRTFKLTEDLDADALSARSEHGVLIVTIPVAASAQPRKVEISS